jgi:hypothetical protein
MREEQNFISANEIDNMVLIMPTATRRSAVVSEGGQVAGGSKVNGTLVLDIKVLFCSWTIQYNLGVMRIHKIQSSL